MNSQDKDRVRKFGEVKTNFSEVKNMLNLVKDETLRIDSKFLEPACGDGNFLAEILKIKLNQVVLKFKNNNIFFEVYALYAITSLYGIEILEDNVLKTRFRLYDILKKFYKQNFKSDFNEEYKKSVKKVILLNIVHGDALSLISQKTKKPIIFSEWSLINDTDFKRREFTFKELLAYQPYSERNLFSDLGDEAFIPSPVKEHKPKNYLNLYEYSQ
jgi:hypothetical protein